MFLIAAQNANYEGYDEAMCQQFCNDAMLAGMRLQQYDGRDSFCCHYAMNRDGTASCDLWEGHD